MHICCTICTPNSLKIKNISHWKIAKWQNITRLINHCSFLHLWSISPGIPLCSIFLSFCTSSHGSPSLIWTRGIKKKLLVFWSNSHPPPLTSPSCSASLSFSLQTKSFAWDCNLWGKWVDWEERWRLIIWDVKMAMLGKSMLVLWNVSVICVLLYERVRDEKECKGL